MDATTIVGSHRLVSMTRTFLDTGVTEHVYGEDPVGFITYGAEGRMMVLLLESHRPVVDHGTITDDDRIALFNSMLSYAGTYTVDGAVVTHHVDASSNGVITGTDLVRRVSVDDQHRLVFSTDPLPTPRDGRVAYTTVVWERIGSVS